MTQQALPSDTERVKHLRQQLLPRKDAAVAAVLKRWNDGDNDVLPLLTSMQQELSALQQELAALENRRLHELQPDGLNEEPSTSAAGHQCSVTIHIQTGKSRRTQLTTNSNELDLSRLEKENSIRVLKLAVSDSDQAPEDRAYEQPVTEALQLQPGQHIWIIAEIIKCSTDLLKRAALASALYLLQVEAALIALSVIKRRVRGLAFSKGLRFLGKHWSGLATWFVSNVLAVEKQEAETAHKH